jgi:RNA polymerase sigma factor (sigma-70 family)
MQQGQEQGPQGQAVTDEELLRRYVKVGSEEAFTDIVRRHLPLVYSICLRRLGDKSKAEDGTQAVFIALSQKARTIRTGAALPAWLQRAANWSAEHIEREARRRARREAEVAEMKARDAHSASEALWEEVRPLLDAAIAALPERQRRVVVLHYLAGRPLADVARDVGSPQGTVATRLFHAVRKLRAILARRGVVVGDALLPSLLAHKTTETAAEHLADTVAASCLGHAAAPGGVLSAAEGIMKAFFWMKLKAAVAILAGAVLLGGAMGVGIHNLRAEEKDAVVAGGATEQQGARKLYVKPTGNDANDGLTEQSAWRTITHAANSAKAGDLVLVAAGDYGAEEVRFPNDGMEGRPIVIQGHGGTPVLQSEDKEKHAFVIAGRKYITVRNFLVKGFGHAVNFCKGSSYCTAENIVADSPGAVGIHVSGKNDHVLIDGCVVRNGGWNGIMAFGTKGEISDITIQNCEVYSQFKHNGIDLHTNVRRAKILNNYVHDSPTMGIFVHSSGVSDIEVRGNLCVNLCRGIWLWNVGGGVIADNTVYQCDQYGIILMTADEGNGVDETKNILVENNVVYKTRMRSPGTWGTGICAESSIPTVDKFRPHHLIFRNNRTWNPAAGSGDYSFVNTGSDVVCELPPHTEALLSLQTPAAFALQTARGGAIRFDKKEVPACHWKADGAKAEFPAYKSFSFRASTFPVCFAAEDSTASVEKCGEAEVVFTNKNNVGALRGVEWQGAAAGAAYVLSDGANKNVKEARATERGSVSFTNLSLGDGSYSIKPADGAENPPAVPSLFTFAISAEEIYVTWNAAQDRTEVKVERKDGPQGTFQTVTTLDGKAREWTDKGLVRGKTYSYRIRAANKNGNSAYSIEAPVSIPSLAGKAEK